jgi:hypothetical protein
MGKVLRSTTSACASAPDSSRVRPLGSTSRLDCPSLSAGVGVCVCGGAASSTAAFVVIIPDRQKLFQLL